MERTADVERDRTSCSTCECELRGGVDAANRTADDQLSGGIEVGHDHDLTGLPLRFVAHRDRSVDIDADQGAHRSVTHRRHRLAALDDKAHRVSGLQRMGGNGCRVLADAVARDRDHIEVAGQRAAQSAFNEEERRLRDFGGTKLLVVTGERRAQIETGRLRRFEHVDGDGEIDQPVRHTGGLAALSGKAECYSGQQDRMVTR